MERLINHVKSLFQKAIVASFHIFNGDLDLIRMCNDFLEERHIPQFSFLSLILEIAHLRV